MMFPGPTSEQLFAVKAMGMMPESQHTHSVHAKLNKYILVHCQLFFSLLDTALYSTIWHGGSGQPAKGKLIFAE